MEQSSLLQSFALGRPVGAGRVWGLEHLSFAGFQLEMLNLHGYVRSSEAQGKQRVLLLPCVLTFCDSHPGVCGGGSLPLALTNLRYKFSFS